MVESTKEERKREFLMPYDIDVSKYINNNSKATG